MSPELFICENCHKLSIKHTESELYECLKQLSIDKSKSETRRSFSPNELKAILVTGAWLIFERPPIIDNGVIQQIMEDPDVIKMGISKEDLINSIHIMVQAGIDIGHVII